MNKNYKWVVLGLMMACAVPVAHAEDLPLPPVPDIAEFDPSNPLADGGLPAAPDAPSPLTPDAIPEAATNPTPDKPSAAADLPLPQGEDSFQFFQPGYQITGDDDGDKEKKPEPVVEIKPEPKKAARPALPLVRFNYKNQHLPATIYKKSYDAQNRHLPVAMYESDYDAATFLAVMKNDLNGLRAMINAGRDLEMRSPNGESLVAVAVRYGSHDALRYLLAKGADPSSAPPQQNQMAHYALQAAGYR